MAPIIGAMPRPPDSLPRRLVDALAAGRATLVVGPAFALGVNGLELGGLIEPLRDRLAEEGWEILSAEERLELCVQAVGRELLAAEIARRLPTMEALRGEVRPRHRALLGLPFAVVVDLALDDLVEATLAQLEVAFRVLGDGDDRPVPGERLLVKLRGDLPTDDPALGAADLRRRVRELVGLRRLLRARAAAGPVLLYGFGLRDPLLPWLCEEVFAGADLFLATRDGHGRWRQHWAEHGLEVLAGGELDGVIDRLGGELRQAEPPASVIRLAAEVADRVARVLAETPQTAWLLDPSAPAPDEVGLDAARGVLDALQTEGLRLPALAAARLAEAEAGQGRAEAAEASIARCLAVRGRGRPEPAVESALGRTLCRLEAFDRARFYLERALDHGDAADGYARAEELSWLARCVLDRVERLRARHRTQAVVETIAGFLSSQAPRLELCALEPDGQVPHRLTLHDLNLRLGLVMVLASEMAAATGQVYAEQAVALLGRAIELAPDRPDAWRALRPLLTGRRHGTTDLRRWTAMLDAAPSDIQRRLAEK